MINLNDQEQVFPSANQVQPDDGGPAFPFTCQGATTAPEAYYGMTLREYAAIKLRVPDSGTDWLDEMIRKSVRDYFAAKASEEDIAEYMPATMGEAQLHPNRTREWARYQHADAMLRARDAS